MTNYAKVKQGLAKAASGLNDAIIAFENVEDYEMLHDIADAATKVQSLNLAITEKLAAKIKGGS